MLSLFVQSIDPFIIQLVIIPFITIGCGVLFAAFLKKVWVAPIVTLILNALDEIYYFKHYYSEIRLTSWSVILPIVSLVISLIIIPTSKTNEKPPIT